MNFVFINRSSFELGFVVVREPTEKHENGIRWGFIFDNQSLNLSYFSSFVSIWHYVTPELSSFFIQEEKLGTW